MSLRKLIIYLLMFQAFIAATHDVEAFMKAPEPSAKLISSTSIEKKDPRVEKLRAYLDSYNSPLAENAEDFVRYADKYNLDWKLVVSIAGLESGYGKHTPAYSYNGWGWGVYGGNIKRFASWEEGIATVSEGLRTNYVDKGASDIYAIGRIYASSPTWAQRVMYFMNRLETYTPEKSTIDLTIAL